MTPSCLFRRFSLRRGLTCLALLALLTLSVWGFVETYIICSTYSPTPGHRCWCGRFKKCADADITADIETKLAPLFPSCGVNASKHHGPHPPPSRWPVAVPVQTPGGGFVVEVPWALKALYAGEPYIELGRAFPWRRPVSVAPAPPPPDGNGRPATDRHTLAGRVCRGVAPVPVFVIVSVPEVGVGGGGGSGGGGANVERHHPGSPPPPPRSGTCRPHTPTPGQGPLDCSQRIPPFLP